MLTDKEEKRLMKEWFKVPHERMWNFSHSKATLEEIGLYFVLYERAERVQGNIGSINLHETHHQGFIRELGEQEHIKQLLNKLVGYGVIQITEYKQLIITDYKSDQGIHEEEFQAARKIILNRDGLMCRICKDGGITADGKFVDIHVHHKDFNHDNNALWNLVTLCASCHRRIHAEKIILPPE